MSDLVGTIFPWLAILGFFGVLLKVRVSGDPALWARVTALEKALEEQRKSFERLMAEERKDCADKLAKMEGRIRQLQQQQASLGHVADDPPHNAASGPLHTAYPVDRTDKDGDLIRKLGKVRGSKR